MCQRGEVKRRDMQVGAARDMRGIRGDMRVIRGDMQGDSKNQQTTTKMTHLSRTYHTLITHLPRTN